MELKREELIDNLDEIEFWPEIKSSLPFYFKKYFELRDIYMMQKILSLGGEYPNNETEVCECPIQDLLFEYKLSKTTKGNEVLDILETLLKAGADPERVWGNNLRAYDYAVAWNISPIIEVLEKYGVNRELRTEI